MRELLSRIVGAQRCARLANQVHIPVGLSDADRPGGDASQVTVAMTLGLVLFEDLLARVPSAARYVTSQRTQGRRVLLDHGAVRTVDSPETGQLPSGAELFRRVLLPLGYQEVGRYPLDRIHMTGRVFTHAVLPEDLPQYFVSELHVDRLDPAAQAAVTRTVDRSTDPLPAAARTLLDALAVRGRVARDDAVRLVPMLAACFGRQHPDPMLTDYETLLGHSPEMAWIATEGNAFNHATDRVPDVDALAATLRADFPVKDMVERSRSGRVRQTALRADRVVRTFRDGNGHAVQREVPGSFFEFISRDKLPDGGLDLSFDAGNAQGIFRMTADAHEAQVPH